MRYSINNVGTVAVDHHGHAVGDCDSCTRSAYDLYGLRTCRGVLDDVQLLYGAGASLVVRDNEIACGGQRRRRSEV